MIPSQAYGRNICEPGFKLSENEYNVNFNTQRMNCINFIENENHPGSHLGKAGSYKQPLK
jgi:hypothetical protein